MKTTSLIYFLLLVLFSCNNLKKKTEKAPSNDTVKKELTSYNYAYEGDLERTYIKHRIMGLKEELEVYNSSNNENDENTIIFQEETEAEILQLNKDYQAIPLIKKGILPIIPPPPPPPPVPCLCFDVFNRLNKIVATNTSVTLSATLTDSNGKKIFATTDIEPQSIPNSELVVFNLNTELEKFTGEGYLTIEKTLKDETKKSYTVSVNIHPMENNR